MKLTSLTKKETLPMYGTQFEALSKEAYQLFVRATEGDLVGTDTRYRFKKHHGTSDVNIVPVRSRAGHKPHSDKKARRCITEHVKTLMNVHGKSNVDQALQAIAALPLEFDPKDVHLALKTLSREEKRAWLKSTATRLIGCIESLRKDPLSFEHLDRPGPNVHGMRDQVEEAWKLWRQVVGAEMGLPSPQGVSEASAVAQLWDPLFEARFGVSELTAAVRPRTLYEGGLNAPYLKLYALYEALGAHVLAVRGKPGGTRLNERTLKLCQDVIDAVPSCIELWVLVAQGLEQLSAATPGTCDALHGDELPERHQEIFLHLACCLIDRCCNFLDLQEGPMRILRYALDCRAAAQLWAERANAHAAMHALLERVRQLPQRAHAASPDATGCVQASRACEKAWEDLQSAQQGFSDAFLPREGQAAFDDGSPQASTLEQLQQLFGLHDLTKQVRVFDPLQSLFRRPLKEIKAMFARYEHLLQEKPSAEQAREMQDTCHRIVELYPPLVARLATAAQLLVDAAAWDGLSRRQQAALVRFARTLAALAKAVMDPASSHRAFYARAHQHLAEESVLVHDQARASDPLPADSSSEEHTV